MQDPYNYPFIQKDNTMYLSTISTLSIIQLKMILAVVLNTFANLLLKLLIFKAHHPKSSFHQNKITLILVFPLMFSQFQIDLSI